MSRKKSIKYISLVLIVSMLAGIFSGCSLTGNSKKTVEKTEEAGKVLAYLRCEFTGTEQNTQLCNFESLSNDSDREYYGFDDEMMDNMVDFFAERATGAEAWEYIILRSTDIELAKKNLENYKDKRFSDFNGYAPTEAEKIENAEIVVVGDYLGLFIDAESKEIAKSFEEALINGFEMSDEAELLWEIYSSMSGTSGTETEWQDTEIATEIVESTEESTENQTSDNTQKPRTKEGPNGVTLVEEVKGYIEVYDTSKIVEAYKADDESILTDEHDLAVLQACKDIISKEINDNMSEYEKEKAIHNYIVENTVYDENCLTYSTWFTEYSDQPYGCLIDHHAICVGYATTFKLFMDIMDIECVVVTGSANNTFDNHGWNLVHLEDGNWYAVDVTWDDPVGWDGATCYNYFNVTDQWLKDTTHHWDEAAFPSATGGEFSSLEDSYY